MTVDEIREHIVSGFIQNIGDIAQDFAQEFCDAINQAEQMKEECRKLRQTVEVTEKDRDEWKRRAEVAERNDKVTERALTMACFDKARTSYPNRDERFIAVILRDEYLRQAKCEIVEEERNENNKR